MHTKSAGGRVVRDVFWQQVRSKFWHCHKGRGSDPCQISLVDLKVKRYVMLESWEYFFLLSFIFIAETSLCTYSLSRFEDILQRWNIWGWHHHDGAQRSEKISSRLLFSLNQDPTFYPSRSSDFLAPSEFWPPGCNFSHVITCVKRPESGYWASMAGWKIRPEQQLIVNLHPNPR